MTEYKSSLQNYNTFKNQFKNSFSIDLGVPLFNFNKSYKEHFIARSAEKNDIYSFNSKDMEIFKAKEIVDYIRGLKSSIQRIRKGDTSGFRKIVHILED